MPDAPPSTLRYSDARGVDPSRLQLLMRAFAHRNYRLFFGGQLVSLVGTFLSQVATVWLVYSLTHNALLLGVVGFAGQIPMFVLAPFAGVWVDRVNRQRLLVLTQTLSSLQSFALAALALTHVINVPEIIALSLFQGIVNAFDIPGRQAFLVEMVTERNDLANAIALNSTMVHGARLIGPAAAGLLIYYVGEGMCFLLDGISYIAVIMALLAMRITPRPPRPPRSVIVELKEGFLYVWGFPPIRVLLIVMGVISLTGMPAFMVLMPIFADHFGGEKGSQTLGFLMASSGVGALIGALALAMRRSVLGLGRLIAEAAVVLGIALLVFPLSHRLWLSLLIMPIAGWAMLTNFASANTVLQTLSDDDKRGRVMSFFTMAFIGMTPFGNLIAGALASRLGGHHNDLLGASRTFYLEGVMCVLAAIAFAIKLPALRKVVQPIYVSKGIIPDAVAAGIETGTEVVAAPEHL
jgi:MFS family permease